MNTMTNINPYGACYIFRKWHEYTPHELAEQLGWEVNEVTYTYITYAERMHAWLSAYGRYPNSEDIDRGDFTLEPFDGSHYDQYLRLN